MDDDSELFLEFVKSCETSGVFVDMNTLPPVSEMKCQIGWDGPLMPLILEDKFPRDKYPQYYRLSSAEESK